MASSGAQQYLEKARIVNEALNNNELSKDSLPEIFWAQTTPYNDYRRTKFASHAIKGIKAVHQKDLKDARASLETIEANETPMSGMDDKTATTGTKRSASSDAGNPRSKRQRTGINSEMPRTELCPQGQVHFVKKDLNAITTRYLDPDTPEYAFEPTVEQQIFRFHYDASKQAFKDALAEAAPADLYARQKKAHESALEARIKVQVEKEAINHIPAFRNRDYTYIEWQKNLKAISGLDPRIPKALKSLMKQAIKRNKEKTDAEVAADEKRRNATGFLRDRKAREDRSVAEEKSYCEAYSCHIAREIKKTALCPEQIVLISEQFRTNVPSVSIPRGQDTQETCKFTYKPNLQNAMRAETSHWAAGKKCALQASEAYATKQSIVKVVKNIEKALAGRPLPADCKPLNAFPPHLRHLLNKERGHKGSSDGPRMVADPLSARHHNFVLPGRSKWTSPMINEPFDEKDIATDIRVGFCQLISIVVNQDTDIKFASKVAFQLPATWPSTTDNILPTKKKSPPKIRLKVSHTDNKVSKGKGSGIKLRMKVARQVRAAWRSQTDNKVAKRKDSGIKLRFQIPSQLLAIWRSQIDNTDPKKEDHPIKIEPKDGKRHINRLAAQGRTSQLESLDHGLDDNIINNDKYRIRKES